MNLDKGINKNSFSPTTGFVPAGHRYMMKCWECQKFYPTKTFQQIKCPQCGDETNQHIMYDAVVTEDV